MYSRTEFLVDLACVASVPVRAKCYVSRASEDSGRAKILLEKPSTISHLRGLRESRIFIANVAKQHKVLSSRHTSVTVFGALVSSRVDYD